MLKIVGLLISKLLQLGKPSVQAGQHGLSATVPLSLAEQDACYLAGKALEPAWYEREAFK